MKGPEGMTVFSAINAWNGNTGIKNNHQIMENDMGNFLFRFYLHFRSVMDIAKDILLIILLWQLVGGDLAVNIWGNIDNHIYGGLDITEK